jgi:flagellar motor protein MotB
MVRTDEDATVWIGYADFLTTLVVLFFLIAVGVAAKARPPQPGYLEGTVKDSLSDMPLQGCSVQLGSDPPLLTSEEGSFKMQVEGVVGYISVGIVVSCAQYKEFSDKVRISAGDTAVVDVQLVRDSVDNDSTIQVNTLPGDALFGTNEARLTDEGVRRIVALRDSLRPGPNEVVVVQGHTDDTRFPTGADKDNWILSAERAAAAARILTGPLGVPECQVAIMGFGHSRPLQIITAEDARDTRDQKRSRNRRIEFRKLRGADLTSGACAGG